MWMSIVRLLASWSHQIEATPSGRQFYVLFEKLLAPSVKRSEENLRSVRTAWDQVTAWRNGVNLWTSMMELILWFGVGESLTMREVRWRRGLQLGASRKWWDWSSKGVVGVW